MSGLSSVAVDNASRQKRLRLPTAVLEWLRSSGRRPQAFQRRAWEAFLAGDSGLIHAPTGSGKTLAAALGPILQTLRSGEMGGESPPLQLLWVTPLRALSEDTAVQIRTMLAGLNLKWSIGIRTGDTSGAERTRQMRRLPTVLITTPESLSLLLSYDKTAQQLRSARSVVVDEWHELLASKRGVQVQLGLAHLRATSAVQVWGLSATMGDLDEALTALLGCEHSGKLIEAGGYHPPKIRTLIPPNLQRFPWAGHLGLSQAEAVVELIDRARSTLVFTNTRSQAERWFEALSSSRIDWLGQVALHHGSLDPKVRRGVEKLMREGKLKCVVATSSLDLGVDFSPVDQVIQIGSAKGVARLLQRAGRSGHHPGGVSELVCVPTHALELVEFAAARTALENGVLESRTAPSGSLDVLVQHLVTLALGGGVDPDSVKQQARTTAAFRSLTDADWHWAVDFVTRGGAALHAYEEYQKLCWQGNRLVPATQRSVRRHRMAVGTIGSDASVRVQFQRGGYLGTIEESFVSRLQPGDVFLFGGRALELCRVRNLVATVKRATRARTLVPRWNGGRMALSNRLADAFLRELAEFEKHGPTTPELRAAGEMLAVQRRWSALPSPTRLVVELQRLRPGHGLYLFPFAGRAANDAIAALVAWRLSNMKSMTITFVANDYGCELFSTDEFALDADTLRALLRPESLEEDLLEASNLAEMSKARFRDIARIAGLVFQGYPGAGKSTRQIQASSTLLFDVLTRYDPDNALLRQARSEVLTELFDVPNVLQALLRMQNQALCLTRPERLTPFSMPLWVDRQGAMLSSESWQQRIDAMLTTLESAADRAVRANAVRDG